jgi:hypothetical protein
MLQNTTKPKPNLVDIKIKAGNMTETEMLVFLDDAIAAAEYDEQAVRAFTFFLHSLWQLASKNLGDYDERIETLERFLFQKTPQFSDQFAQFIQSAKAEYRLQPR